MKIITTLFLSATIASLTACTTAGNNTAQNLTVIERMKINAPVAKVWQAVNNFGDLGAWHPAVAKTEIVAGDNNHKGAVRLLTLQDGGTIKETLTDYNAANKNYSYVINEGVLPVSQYASTITVMPSGTGSEVVWQGQFKRKDISSSPAKGQDDKTALATITAVYQAGLANLKKISE